MRQIAAIALILFAIATPLSAISQPCSNAEAAEARFQPQINRDSISGVTIVASDLRPLDYSKFSLSFSQSSGNGYRFTTGYISFPLSGLFYMTNEPEQLVILADRHRVVPRNIKPLPTSFPEGWTQNQSLPITQGFSFDIEPVDVQWVGMSENVVLQVNGERQERLDSAKVSAHLDFVVGRELLCLTRRFSLEISK